MPQLYSTGPAHVFVGRFAIPGFSSPTTTGGTSTLSTGGSTGGASLTSNTTGNSPGVPGVGPFYLGTCRISPEIHIKPSFEPVYNDVGGKVPLDMSYEGEEGFTAGDFTRWDERVYALLADRPASLGAPGAGVRGLNGPRDIGSLIITEGLNFCVWIVFPFATQKTAYATLPAGYRFPGSYLIGPDDHKKMGTSSKDLFLMFHHLRLFDARTGRFLLYDSDMTAVNNIPLGP